MKETEQEGPRLATFHTEMADEIYAVDRYLDGHVEYRKLELPA